VGGENWETRRGRSRAGLLRSPRNLHLDLAAFGARQSLRNSPPLLALLGTALATLGRSRLFWRDVCVCVCVCLCVCVRWRCNSGELPHFAFVLRTVLTNAPNSCPPERLLSMFNATFGEDQQRSFGATLSWQCNLSTTNAMYESLGVCHCCLFFGLVEYCFPREVAKYTHTHTHTTHTQHTHTHTHAQAFVTRIGSIIRQFLQRRMHDSEYERMQP